MVGAQMRKLLRALNKSKQRNKRAAEHKPEQSLESIIAGWRDENEFYDEIHDVDGCVRETYAGLWPVVQQIEEAHPERIAGFAAQSLKDFKGDNKLFHIPRMMSKQESDTIHSGVVQRARFTTRLAI